MKRRMMRLVAFLAMIPAMVLWDLPRFIWMGDTAFNNPLFARIIDWGEGE